MASECPIRLGQFSCKCLCPTHVRHGHDTHCEVSVLHRRKVLYHFILVGLSLFYVLEICAVCTTIYPMHGGVHNILLKKSICRYMYGCGAGCMVLAIIADSATRLEHWPYFWADKWKNNDKENLKEKKDKLNLFSSNSDSFVNKLP